MGKGRGMESWFRLADHNSNVRIEASAGLTTFLAMAYISVVNPSILAQAGMDFGWLAYGFGKLQDRVGASAVCGRCAGRSPSA